MNTPEDIKNAVSELIPGASILIDKADLPTGSSWLDIELDNQKLTIECKPSMGFGLYSSNDDSFGTRPDEIYRSVDSLLKRVVMILNEHKSVIKLKEVRELLGKTQGELSILSGQKQPSISKLERRDDFQLSSIEKVINALGGTIEIKVHFNEFDVPIDLSSGSK